MIFLLVILAGVLLRTESLLINTAYAKMGGTANLTCPFEAVKTWISIRERNIVSYTNRKDVNPNLPFAKRLAVSEINSLIIKNVTNFDFRIYRCTGINSSTEKLDTYDVQLKKANKPNITIQAYPHNTTMEGNPIELRCNDEEGSTNVISRYKWQHNGKYLSHSLKILQINVTTRMDNGNFTCTAENEAGEARDTLEVNVLYAPVIENYSVSFFENNHIILINCIVSGNPNNFTFGEWKHISNVNYIIRHLNGSEEGRLNISSFAGTAKTYENGGVYVCNVSNGIPSTDGSLWRTGTIEVIIKGKPNITIQAYPDNTTMEGNPIELRCNDEEGSTNVISRYKWDYNGRHLQHTLKVLKINVTTRMDNGNFSCTAENEAGEARDTIEINVLYAPVIENYSVSFFENNSHILVNCNASGNPNEFTFGEWTHSSDVDTVIRHLNGSNDGLLAITSFTGRANAYEIGGVYVCNVSNGIPSTDGSLWQTGKIHVIIKGPPMMPQLTTLERTPYAILVEWEPGFNGSHRTTFEIEYRKVTEIKWDRNHIKENIRNTFFIADPNTDYVVRMKALNKYGQSSFTKEHTVLTEEFITDHMGSQQFIAIFVMLSILYLMAAVFGLKYAVKNGRCFSKYKDRVTPFNRREEVSVTPGHYYDIDSMYHNPINNTMSSQNHRIIAELGIQQLSNMTDNFDDTNSSSYQGIGPCTVRQVESCQENYSARSSTDESYRISRRMSDLSETCLKSIKRYETLNFPAKNENMYTT